METGDSCPFIGVLVEGHLLEARTPIKGQLSPIRAPAAARGPIASHIERVGGGSDFTSEYPLGYPVRKPRCHIFGNIFR